MTYTPDVQHQNDPMQGAYPHPGAPVQAPGPKLAPTWVGALMALGAIVTAVGTFLPYEKLVVFANGGVASTLTFTGVGSRSATGAPLFGLSAGNAGKVTLGLAAILLVLGVLTVARKGRLWLGIVATLLAAGAVLLAFASFSAPKSDATKLNNVAPDGISVTALTKLGVDIAVAGAGVALLGALLALVLRRRSV